MYFYDNGLAGVLAQVGEGALFKNAVFCQLHPYGALSYLARGNDYEVDFILQPHSGAPRVALEVKTHPVPADKQKLARIAATHNLGRTYVIGRFPTPGFTDFLWGGHL